MKYKNKGKTYTVCPAEVVHLQKTTVVLSAKNSCFLEGPNHGGKGLKDGKGKLDKSIRFGPKIEEPE